MGAPKKEVVEHKRGALSLEELKFIEKNLGVLTPEKMAKQLNRNMPPILKAIEKIKDGRHSTINRLNDEDAGRDLRIRPFWKQLKKQYNKEELELYEFHWAQLRAQFNNDVTHAEELQICRAIDVDLQMHRNKVERYQIDEQIETLQRQLDRECAKPENEQDRDFIQAMMQNLASMRSSQMTRTKENMDMLDKHMKMLQALKSTRDQRFREIQERKVTFEGWIAKYNEAKQREVLSHEAEILGLAAEKSAADLSEYHKYDDGEVDIPMLNSDTVREDS